MRKSQIVIISAYDSSISNEKMVKLRKKLLEIGIYYGLSIVVVIILVILIRQIVITA